VGVVVDTQQRRTVRLAVENYRNASNKLRQLKEGYQGSVVNPSLRLAHANTMRELANQLETLGHQRIASMLSQWHSYLMLSRRQFTTEKSKEMRSLARRVSSDINRAIEEIR